MNVQQEKNTYMVFPPGDQTAQTHKANEAVVEPSGVLALYNIDQNGKRHLIQAYSSGAWRKVSLSANV